MLDARLNWKLKEHPILNGELGTLLKQSEYSEAFLRLCFLRGIDTKEKIEQFLNQDKTIFHDPFLLHEMDKAVKRITQAIESGESIMVFGDYDADGITSTAILVETLEGLGADVSYHLPNRFEDGYGPNPKLFQHFVDTGIELIITCDNGVTGHESIDLANQNQVDVIVTDHHEIPTTLPEAHAVIHPRHPDGNYPFDDLSGAGVALKVAAALLKRVPYELFDIAAIGTVADLVSLTDENRWIVKQGIKALKQTERLGLHILFENTSVQENKVDEETIGFIVGPRLNALGRLGDASPGVELLLSFDEERLIELVEEIQKINTKRQAIVNDISESVFQKLDQLEELPLVVVLADEEWHEGVLGIVASRIVEKTGRPTILLSIDKERGIAKGSARSVDALHIYEALQSASTDILKFGGHKMAAGLSVETENIESLTRALQVYALPMKEEIEKGETIFVDEILGLSEVTLTFLEEVNLLRPFGTDNPKPIFGFKDVPVLNIKKIGADQQHLKMLLQNQENHLDVIGFNQGSLAEHLSEQQEISAVGELSVNTWRDISKPQLQLKDLKIEAVQYFDLRSSKFDAESLSKKDSVYLFFNRRFFDQTASKLPHSSVAVLLESDDPIPQFASNLSNVVILDCPTNEEHLKSFFNHHHFANYYLYAYPIDSVIAEGLPTKEQFANVYRYFRQRQNMDVRTRLDALANYLKISKKLLIFIISVFLEAKFVTIDNGILNPIKNPERVNLVETGTYQQRVQKIKVEKLFIYSSFAEVTEWFRKLEA